MFCVLPKVGKSLSKRRDWTLRISNNISASSLETNSRIDLQVLEGNHDISLQPGYVGTMDPISKL